MTRVEVYDRKRLGAMLYGLTTNHGKQLWSRVILRKPKPCSGCGAALAVGDAAYSPISNAANRMERLCPPCVESK